MSTDAVYLVVLTRMKNVPVVVVGGGQVGERKIKGLLVTGAAVRLISPKATPQLQLWAEADRIHWKQRPYQAGDLSGAHLVFAATNRREVNAKIAKEAEALGLLCNVADEPDDGNFYLPAVYRGQDLVIAVSTAGKSPTQARRIRDGIAEWLKTQAKVGDKNGG